jgi:hypothetical protein
LNKEKGYKGGSFSLLIQKEEVDDPTNEKGVGSPTVDVMSRTLLNN